MADDVDRAPDPRRRLADEAGDLLDLLVAGKPAPDRAQCSREHGNEPATHREGDEDRPDRRDERQSVPEREEVDPLPAPVGPRLVRARSPGRGRIEPRTAPRPPGSLDLPQHGDDELFVVVPVRPVVLADAAPVVDLVLGGYRRGAGHLQPPARCWVVRRPEVPPPSGPQLRSDETGGDGHLLGLLVRRHPADDVEAQVDRLAVADERVDRDVPERGIGERHRRHDRPPGVTDDDDPLAAVVPQRADRPDEAAPDVRRLRRIGQENPRVAPPRRQERLELLGGHRVLHGRDGDERCEPAHCRPAEEHDGDDGRDEQPEPQPAEPLVGVGRVVPVLPEDRRDDPPDGSLAAAPVDHRLEGRGLDRRGPPRLGRDPRLGDAAPLGGRPAIAGHLDRDHRDRLALEVHLGADDAVGAGAVPEDEVSGWHGPLPDLDRPQHGFRPLEEELLRPLAADTVDEDDANRVRDPLASPSADRLSGLGFRAGIVRSGVLAGPLRRASLQLELGLDVALADDGHARTVLPRGAPEFDLAVRSAR